MTERRKDEKEQGDKKEPAGLLANGLSVHPPVYLPDCDILADEESDQTYGFISKQPLDQTRPGQVLHSSDLCAGFSAPTEKLSLRSASLERGGGGGYYNLQQIPRHSVDQESKREMWPIR